MQNQVTRNQVSSIVDKAIGGMVEKVRSPVVSPPAAMATTDQQRQVWEKYRVASPEQRIAFVANANRGVPREQIVTKVDEYEVEMTRRFGL